MVQRHGAGAESDSPAIKNTLKGAGTSRHKPLPLFQEVISLTRHQSYFFAGFGIDPNDAAA